MENIVIVVRYNEKFIANEDWSWEYINGRNIIRVIRSNYTNKEPQKNCVWSDKDRSQLFSDCNEVFISLML